jgi:hypothetical protein
VREVADDDSLLERARDDRLRLRCPPRDERRLAGRGGAAWAGAVTFRRNGRPTGFSTMMFTLRLADAGDNRFVRCVLLDFGGDATIREDANRDGDCSNG